MAQAREAAKDSKATTGEAPPTPDGLDLNLEGFVREAGPSLSKGDAQRLLSEASAAARRFDERQLEDRYDVGEKLVLFASARGHRALGYAALGPCLRERFSLGRSWAYESMRISKLATRSELPGLTWAQARLGAQLAAALGVDSFEALGKQPLPVGDGEVFFPAPTDVLELALSRLTARRPAQPEEDPRGAERAAFRRAQTLVDEHLAKHPALAEARPKVFVRDGHARIRIAAVDLRAEALSAVSKLFVALDRALRD